MSWVLKSLNQTIGEKCVIGDDNIYELLTYVDTSYTTQNYMRVCTGGCMPFGWGLIHARSSKQRLNTKSSTVSEVVGARNHSPFRIWLAMYMEHQGYRVKWIQIMQDNISAIKMEKNGWSSCTGNYRHIHIRYLFFMDRIDRKDIEIFNCPTRVMLADYFTNHYRGEYYICLEK